MGWMTTRATLVAKPPSIASTVRPAGGFIVNIGNIAVEGLLACRPLMATPWTKAMY
jgi:hypothetical protein